MFLLALKSKNSIRLCAKRSAHFFQEKRFLSVLPFFADLCDRSTYANFVACYIEHDWTHRQGLHSVRNGHNMNFAGALTQDGGLVLVQALHEETSLNRGWTLKRHISEPASHALAISKQCIDSTFDSTNSIHPSLCGGSV